MTELDEREQLSRIDKALADIDLALGHAALEREQLRQLSSIDLAVKTRNYRLEVWRVLALALTGLGAWSAFLVFALGHWWRP
jgi:hypothetical protein